MTQKGQTRIAVGFTYGILVINFPTPIGVERQTYLTSVQPLSGLGGRCRYLSVGFTYGYLGLTPIGVLVILRNLNYISYLKTTFFQNQQDFRPNSRFPILVLY